MQVLQLQGLWKGLIGFLFIFPPNSKGGMVLEVIKGTNGRQKTYEISHVYSIFYSGFMCQTTVFFGITKDGSLYQIL